MTGAPFSKILTENSVDTSRGARVFADRGAARTAPPAAWGGIVAGAGCARIVATASRA